ncbi:unnamed protein product, partial [marine sediment metagenome]
IAVDATGNIYITGNFSDTATFGSYTLSSAGLNDIFVAKLDANGNFLWVERAGGIAMDVGGRIAVGASGVIYIAGKFEGTTSFGSYTMTSAGGLDIFVVQFYPPAEAQVNLTMAASPPEGGSVTPYPGGSPYTVDTGVPQAISATRAAGFNFANWTANPPANASIADANATNTTVTLTGDATVTANFAEAVDWLWATTTGGTGGGIGFAVAADASGNIYITGNLNGTATFGLYTLTSAGSSDIFVAKLDSNGTFLWAVSAGGVSQ